MNATQSLKGKVALVTGAGRGIGRAISLRLAAAGANVVLVARSSDQITETQHMIEKAGGRALPARGDVTDEKDVIRIVNETNMVFRRIDVLVNNAGVAPMASIEKMETSTFDQMVATNIRAVHLCSHAVWPIMAKGGGGAIVNISSIASFDPFPGLGAYGAAKAFINIYTKALAVEGAEKKIRVYAVAPGAVETQMLRGVVPDYPGDKALAPDDVAALVENLLSPACQHISGQVIVIKKD